MFCCWPALCHANYEIWKCKFPTDILRSKRQKPETGIGDHNLWDVYWFRQRIFRGVCSTSFAAICKASFWFHSGAFRGSLDQLPITERTKYFSNLLTRSGGARMSGQLGVQSKLWTKYVTLRLAVGCSSQWFDASAPITIVRRCLDLGWARLGSGTARPGIRRWLGSKIFF